MYSKITTLIVEIRLALKSLKEKNTVFIDSFELNKDWRKIYNSLLAFGKQQDISKLITLKLCQVEGDEKSYFSPHLNKTPITMCYNKINKKSTFEQQALYNGTPLGVLQLILLYDQKIKPESTDWNDIQSTLRSTIRALHLSGLCQKKDRGCFDLEIKRRVLEKQRFKGIIVKNEEMNQIFRDSVEDYEPISQVFIH